MLLVTGVFSQGSGMLILSLFDVETGLPVADAEVLVRPGEIDILPGHSDESGYVEILLTDDSTVHELIVQAAGYLPVIIYPDDHPLDSILHIELIPFLAGGIEIMVQGDRF